MNEVKSREQYVAEGGPNIPEYGGPLGIWIYNCTINAFKALLNEVGLNRALEAVRHYNEAWGRTIAAMVKERLGPQENDLEQIAMSIYYAHNCTSMGHIKPLEIYEGGAICEIFACPNPGMDAPPEACIVMSHVMTEGACRAVNPEYECFFTNHLGDGDDCCRWVVKKKGSKFTIDNLGMLRKTIPLEVPMGERMMFNMTMVVMRQLVIFTSALIDLVGSQRTLDLVVPMARETGARLGTIMKGGMDTKGDLSMIKEKIELLLSGFQQSGTPAIVVGSGLEREIVGCPWSGAPPEVCKQFEAALDGVCEAINPDYEFAYDHMMTNGDLACHWTVSRRKEAVEVGEDKETSGLDPARTLALRFAKGEISHEEFDRRMELLKKHQVINE